MLKTVVAILIAFLIGAGCRLFGIPVPAPPAILGVVLIFAITIGYIAADNYLARRNANAPPVSASAQSKETLKR